jgi:hypothetical protein
MHFHYLGCGQYLVVVVVRVLLTKCRHPAAFMDVYAMYDMRNEEKKYQVVYHIMYASLPDSVDICSYVENVNNDYAYL